MQEPRGVSLELGYSTDLSVPTCREQEKISPARKSTRGVQDCTSSTTGQGTDRERCKEGASVGGTGRTSARSAQPANPREPGIFLEIVGDSKAKSGERASHSVFNLIFENDDRSRARVLQNDAGA